MTEEPQLPLLSIIIPVLHLKRPINKKRFFMPRQTIAECLDDISRNVRMPYEVVVVCNSADPELQAFIQQHKGIRRYCLNSENVGVARAWNMGAQLADGEILCFLNDDVSVGPGALESMSRQLLADETIGEIGPAGSLWKDCRHHSFVEASEPTQVDVVSGFCFLMRSATFHASGGFDVNYTPAGCEEIDMCYRLRQVGMMCVIDPRVDIKHYHHHSVSSYRVEIEYMGKRIDTEALHERNSAYFRKKWGGVFP